MDPTPTADVSTPATPLRRRLGAVLWYRWIRARYESVYAYSVASGRDRSQLRRQLTGERSRSLPVKTAMDIEKETGGAVPVESWGEDSDLPVADSLDDVDAEFLATVDAEPDDAAPAPDADGAA